MLGKKFYTLHSNSVNKVSYLTNHMSEIFNILKTNDGHRLQALKIMHFNFEQDLDQLIFAL